MTIRGEVVWFHRFLCGLTPKEDGETSRIKVIEAISDHHDANSVYKPTVKFKCSVNNDAYEEVLSYNQILDTWQRRTMILYGSSKRS